MKPFPLWLSLVCLFGNLTAEILKEEKTLAIAGFQHAGSLSEIVCFSDGIHVLSSSRDECVRMWEIATGQLVRTFTEKDCGSMWGIRILPGEKEFLAAAGSGKVIRFEIATGKVVMSYEHSETVYRIALHPDGKRFVATDDASMAILWDLATGEKIQAFNGHTSDVYTAIFIEGGKKLITGSSDNSFKVWDVESGKCLETSEKKYDDIYTMALSPNGARFAMVSDDDHVRVFEAKDRKEIWSKKLSEDGQVVVWSPDGKMVATASDDRNIYVLDSEDGKEICKVQVANSAHTPVAFTKDGSMMISGGDQHLHLHEVATWQRVEPTLGIPMAPTGFSRLAVNYDGQSIYSAEEEVLYLWSRKDGSLRSEIDEEESIYGLKASPDGKLIAVGLEDGAIQLRAAYNGEKEAVIASNSQVNALAFLPSSQSLLSGGNDGVIRQWSLENHRKIQEYQGHRKSITDIVVAPGEATFASASADKTVRIWSLEIKETVAAINIPKHKPRSLAFLNEGRSLIVAIDEPQVWGRFLPAPKPQDPIDLEELELFIAQLASKEFELRKSGTENLVELGEEVLAHLAEFKNKDPEVMVRLQKVREKIIGGGGQDSLTKAHTFEADFNMVAANPNGRYWAGTVGGRAGAKIVIGEVLDEKFSILQTIESDHFPDHLAFSGDGNTLVSANLDGTLTVYSVNSDEN